MGVIDARELVSDGSRVIAAIRAEGYVVPPFPVPELSVLADPGFQWPDVELPLHGAHFWETSDDRLSGCSRHRYGFYGRANVATGALEVAGHSLAVADRSVYVD